MSDDAHRYTQLGWNFARHGVVNHRAEEYVSVANPTIHTNTVEGFYSMIKRGMRGVYQHCRAHHLHRYVAEFDFRYTNRAMTGCNDNDRAARCIAALWASASPIGGLEGGAPSGCTRPPLRKRNQRWRTKH